MYEFNYLKAANLTADEIHDEMILLAASLKNIVDQKRSTLSEGFVKSVENSISRIKNNINVVINVNELENEEINMNLIQNLINSSNQLNVPLNMYIMGNSDLNQGEESVDMLFSQKILDQFTKLNNLLVKNGKNPLKFMEDQSAPETAWTLDEVLNANNQIDSVVEFIKKQNLSPYEVAAFIHQYITSSFEYKDSENAIMSRSIVGVLNSDKIVCVGYAKYFKAIIDKLNMKGLECETFLSSITPTDDVSNDICAELNISPFGMGHMQNLIKINDPKYKINGCYATDACWDAKSLFFPAGKGFGNFMFPVTDLVTYQGLQFDQVTDEVDALMQLCNIDQETIDPNEIPIIKENIKKSKPIGLEKLQKCLANVYKVLYPKASESEISRRVAKAIEVSKLISKSVFSNTSTNAISVEAYKNNTLGIDQAGKNKI